MCLHRFLVAVLLSLGASPATAQRPPWLGETYLKPAVYGRLRDSVSGEPARGVRIVVEGRVGYSASDSLGYYLLFDLPPGEQRVRFLCPSRSLVAVAVVATRTVRVEPRTDSLANFTLPVSSCEDPPLRSVRGDFAGLYTEGFESSVFVPCRPFVDLRGTTLEGVRQRAWLTLSEGARRTARLLDWPDVPAPRGYRTYYLRVRGTLEGPGNYGHLGMSTFGLTVDRILEIRAEPPGSCRVES